MIEEEPVDWTTQETAALAAAAAAGRGGGASPLTPAAPGVPFASRRAESPSAARTAAAAVAPLPAAPTTKKEEEASAFTRLANDVSRAERHDGRRYEALRARVASSISGVAPGDHTLSSWDTRNRLDDQQFELANTVGSLAIEVYTHLEALRDELRLGMAELVERHTTLDAPSRSPEDIIAAVFPSSTLAIRAIKDGLRALMPQLSASVRLCEPLRVATAMRRQVEDEAERPLGANPGDAACDEGVLRVAKRRQQRRRQNRQGQPAAKVEATMAGGGEGKKEDQGRRPLYRQPKSTTDAAIWRRDPTALEILLSPRTVLPTPTTSTSSAARSRLQADTARAVSESGRRGHRADVAQLRTAMYQRFGVESLVRHPTGDAAHGVAAGDSSRPGTSKIRPTIPPASITPRRGKELDPRWSKYRDARRPVPPRTSPRRRTSPPSGGGAQDL